MHIDQFNHLTTPPNPPTTQALAYLATVWSVDIKARLHYRPVHQLAEATHVKVVPHAFVGTRAIVPLHGCDWSCCITFNDPTTTQSLFGASLQKCLRSKFCQRLLGWKPRRPSPRPPSHRSPSRPSWWFGPRPRPGRRRQLPGQHVPELQENLLKLRQPTQWTPR